jgi:predicted DNA-binding transcriptional regulator AlpA
MSTTKNDASSVVLPVIDLALWLGVHVETLRKWMVEHEDFPKPRRIGKRPYFLVEEVREWLKNQPAWRGIDAANAN